jgi:hypothetical protein
MDYQREYDRSSDDRKLGGWKYNCFTKNSKILYPEKFEKEQRKVILIGEAFFEVAKNPSRPFLYLLIN